MIMHNLWPYSDVHVSAVCSIQISELSVDLESKQKELQSVQQDRSSLEEQLTSLVRKEETQYVLIAYKHGRKIDLRGIQEEDNALWPPSDL